MEGDVQVNGAPSTAHWLQQGDTLEFSDGLSASVEQLGVVEQAIDSLMNEDQSTQAEPLQTTPVQAAPETLAAAPLATEDAQDTFKPATAAASYSPEPQEVVAPAESTAPAESCPG